MFYSEPLVLSLFDLHFFQNYVKQSPELSSMWTLELYSVQPAWLYGHHIHSTGNMILKELEKKHSSYNKN